MLNRILILYVLTLLDKIKVKCIAIYKKICNDCSILNYKKKVLIDSVKQQQIKYLSEIIYNYLII